MSKKEDIVKKIKKNYAIAEIIKKVACAEKNDGQ